MPTTSIKQHRFMEMIAHNPKAAKKAGVPQSVGKEMVAHDDRIEKYMDAIIRGDSDAALKIFQDKK